jgi:hypothetical protein
MKKCSAAFLLVMIVATLAVGVQKPDDGINYLSPEGRYRVLFPAQPKLTSQLNTNSEGLKFTQYLASAGDENSLYMVGYFDLAAGVTYSLDKARDGMMKAVNGTLVSEAPITLDGNVGRELLASVTDANGVDYLVTARLYNVDMRVYVVQFLRAKLADDKVLAAKAARFFDSFQLVKS